MNQLYPDPLSDVDVYDAYRPVDPAAPLVRINMVSALDGHIVDTEGVSEGLGGDGDRQAFFAMRHQADAVMAGAGTVRADGYGPMCLRKGWGERRAADGREGPASIVIVTGSVNLDPSSTIFTNAVAPTFVLTTTDAPADKVRAVTAAGAHVVRAGQGTVDLAAGIVTLRDDHGLNHLLVEGGPTLNGQLISAGLVDELCLTLASVLAGGTGTKRVVDGLPRRQDVRLMKVLEHDGELLLTYRFDH